MKQFFGIFMVCLLFLLIFFFFGGFLLFYPARHPYLTAAIVAFLVALIIHAYVCQSEKIDALEKRIENLEKTGGHHAN